MCSPGQMCLPRIYSHDQLNIHEAIFDQCNYHHSFYLQQASQQKGFILRKTLLLVSWDLFSKQGISKRVLTLLLASYILHSL